MTCDNSLSVWHIIPRSTPKIIRKCSRCDRDRFYSSDKFRVNANKKLIDVWLIYKCVHCDTTLNLPIIHRTAITKIAEDLLNRFQNNDQLLCWQYAFDGSLFQKGMKIDWDIDIVIQEQLLANHLAFEASGKAQIQIKSDYHLKIPIFSVLRSKMQMSRSQLEKLQNSQTLQIFNCKMEPIASKDSIGHGCILTINNF